VTGHGTFPIEIKTWKKMTIWSKIYYMCIVQANKKNDEVKYIPLSEGEIETL